MKKFVPKTIFSLTALILFAFSAFPAGAQVTLVEPDVGCVLVEKIEVKTGGGTLTINKGTNVKESTTASMKGDSGTKSGTYAVKEWAVLCLFNTINVIINWISLIVLILSTGMIIYAGFLWMTGGDNPEFKQRSGKVLLAALVGFGIVVLAKVLPGIIQGVLL